MAPRRCSQHSHDKILQCHPYLLNFRVCIHRHHHRNKRNLRRHSKAGSRRETTLLLVPYQMRGRRSDFQHSQACSARAIQLPSCRESSSCQEKRRRRRKLKGTLVSLFHSLSPRSNGLRRTRSLSAPSTHTFLLVADPLRMDRQCSLWTHALDPPRPRQRCNHKGNHNSHSRKCRIKRNQATHLNSRDRACRRRRGLPT